MTSEKAATAQSNKFKKRFVSPKACKSEPEVSILPCVLHYNIVKVRQIVYHKHKLYIAMDCAMDTLEDVFETVRVGTRVRFTDERIRGYMMDIMEGVHAIHSKLYMHCDINPENILRFDNKRLKIGDFGSAQVIANEERLHSYEGARSYRAPELTLGSLSYTEAVDIFACGCILAEFFLLEPIFQAKTSKEIFMAQCKILGTPSEEDWPEGYILADSDDFDIPYYPRNEPVADRLMALIPEISPQCADLLSKMLEFNPK
ncbi:unnamed protein product [Moneuplotes crassus]|uniref:Cyclin-dependent kinase 2 homolog n=1 Tax=Euplotes crassus TaxID=5936 RepID=A0AAD1U705_EUPCR|nr:unnamed protein product [Moneuplotes crassus]